MRVTDYRAIINTEDTTQSWVFPHEPGIGAIITYRFLDEAGLVAEGATRREEPQVLTESQRDVYRAAFAQFADAADLRFVEVGPDDEAMIGLHNASRLGSTLGYAEFFPRPNAAPDSLLVVIKHRDGTYKTIDEETVLHEVGHALGLEHPFEGEFKLPRAVMNTDTTVMAYDFGSLGRALTLRDLDIEAIQHYYGTGNSAASADVSFAAGRMEIGLGAGDDVLIAPWHDSFVEGGAGQDRLFGRQGLDTLMGGTGADQLDGGRKADILRGGPGQDMLMGRDGRDILGGGRGEDILAGGEGRDVLRGGAGSDTFQFTTADIGATDVVRDYGLGEDRLVLGGDLDLANATIISVQDGSAARLQVTSEFGVLKVLFEGVSASALEADLGL